MSHVPGIPYREVLADPMRFSERQVVIEGVWELFFEHSLLHDDARHHLQPTWVTLADTMTKDDKLVMLRACEKINSWGEEEEIVRMHVKLKGIFLYRANADILADSRFGHLRQHHSELLISEIIVMQHEPIQPAQHNAGDRPSSDGFCASETPSSLGPRG